MMRLIKTTGWLVMAAAIIFGTAACSSSDDSIAEQQPMNPTAPKTYTMTVQVTKGDAAATRGLSLDGKTLNVKWNEGEMVYVLQQDKDHTADWNYVGKLTAAASSNATTTLSGTLTVETGESGTDLDTDAPALRFVLHGNALGSGNASDYSTGQNGLLTGTGSIEEKYDFASCDVAKTSYTIDTEAKTVSVTGDITLVSEQAIVKFSLYQADGTTPINATSLAITSTGDMKKGRAYESDATTITTQSVSLTGLEGSTNNLYVALCNYNATAYTLTATDAAGNTYTYGPKTATFTDGKYYEVKVKMKTHEYVDLGLSVKWATMNVGAESVTDRGLYFAWGETTGHAFGSGYKFSLDNYAWYNDGVTGKYTKYKYDGSSWDYEELASEDDAAAKNWGGVWRIPTRAEWEELLNEDNCTWTWTTDYKGDGSNVAGVIVTSKKDGYTDKSIFLPATGIYNGNNNTGSEICANYWSKSLDTSNSGTEHAPIYNSFGFAWKLEILYYNGSFYYKRVQNEYRYYGIGVRAVRE
ncbi:MAG: hypothetical protein J5913_08150 [Prevotella sp.]|nr:hypothetical protein [Prevotella sp.]